MKNHTGGIMLLGLGGIAQKSTKHKLNEKLHQSRAGRCQCLLAEHHSMGQNVHGSSKIKENILE